MLKTILVGNSADILKSDAGKKIDAYDCVIRFNNYRIGGFEKQVGERTSIWCTRIDTNVDYSLNKGVDFVIGIVNWCKRSETIESLIPFFLAHFNKPYIIQKQTVRSYARQFGYNPAFNNYRLSVGIITLMYLLEKGYNDITLHGFSGDTSKHYFNIDPVGHNKHNWILEKRYIDEQIESGKVRYFD